MHTNEVKYQDPDTTMLEAASDGYFRFGLNAYTDKAYTISTSNEALKDFESLRYGIQVIRDEVPKIKVQMARDSVNPNLAYFAGELADDYGLKNLRVAVWETGREQEKSYIDLPISGDLYHTFYYTFPSGLDLQAGRDYSVQFEVTDNDGLRGGKRAKSNVFGLRQLDGEELRSESLKYQRSVLGGMNKAKEEQEKIREGLEEFQRMQKEGGEMNFNDLQRLEENINRQLRQEELMKKFSKELKETMEKDPQDNAFKKILEERLERQEAQARKNEELMKQMKEVLDKLDKEELQERMDELGKQQSSNERSLEQLLELTKRYYVQQQARLLGRRLQKLGEKQEVLSEINDNIEGLGKKEQQKLNTTFDSIQNGLSRLEKDNQDLKKPLGWKRDLKKENEVKSDQQDALKELDKLNLPENAAEDGRDAPESASRKQKAAARKIKELAEALEQQASSGSQSANAEDAEMLRQILDNLITFSFEQETLFSRIQNRNNNVYSSGGISGINKSSGTCSNMWTTVCLHFPCAGLRSPKRSISKLARCTTI